MLCNFYCTQGIKINKKFIATNYICGFLCFTYKVGQCMKAPCKGVLH